MSIQAASELGTSRHNPFPHVPGIFLSYLFFVWDNLHVTTWQIQAGYRWAFPVS